MKTIIGILIIIPATFILSGCYAAGYGVIGSNGVSQKVYFESLLKEQYPEAIIVRSENETTPIGYKRILISVEGKNDTVGTFVVFYPKDAR